MYINKKDMPDNWVDSILIPRMIEVCHYSFKSLEPYFAGVAHPDVADSLFPKFQSSGDFSAAGGSQLPGFFFFFFFFFLLVHKPWDVIFIKPFWSPTFPP